MAEEVVELSIEETNRLRASLGLKPLSSGPPKAQLKPKPEAKPEVDAEELRNKLQDAREKRRREAELRKTKTLGEASADVDDVASWISKIKPGQPAAADADAAAAGGKPAKRARRGDAAAADGAEHTAADLAGVAVRHDLGDLTEGETVVLTLADTGILDEKGQLADGPDQLVDVLSMQEKARRKARAAATKTAKPLWEEDGKVRGLLDKYDEEEEEAVAAFDAAGQLQAQQRREEELRKRLAAGKALLDPASSGGGLPASSDYYTAEEAAAMKGGGKEKKKKKRKLRTTKVSGEEDAEAAAGLDLDALEAAAAAEGAADLGSRDAREQRRKDAEAARAAAQADRAARFEAALGRANIASEALRPSKAAAAAADEGSDDADDELAASLARARRLAQKAAGGSGGEAAAAAAGGSEAAAAADGAAAGSSLEEIAKQLARKREEDEAKLREQIASGTAEAFTETTEFVRSIQVTGPKAAEDGSSYMDVDEPAAAAADAAPLPPPPADSKPPTAAKQQRKYRTGGWMAADGQEDEEQQDEAEAAAAAAASSKRRAPELEDTGVVGERAIGKGLAACLGLLKEKGTLKDKMQWAGRTNDKKPVALIGLQDVYTGGSHEDAMSQRIEVALTQRDEFGRVMTPKERFRVMCHQFHGKPPSKNKQEERQRKYLEEVAIAKATTSENPSAELDRLKELQRTTGSAYIPLTGKGRLGASGSRSEDPLSGLATARSGAGGASVALTPVLGGGLTPLAGNRKVEAMLGISKPSGGSGKGSMLPPAPRK